MLRSNKNLIFWCSHCSCTIFVLTSYSLYTQVMIIIDFKWCSVFTECCFYLWKRFEWSISLLFRFPTPDKKNLPYKTSHLLPINFIWKTLECQFKQDLDNYIHWMATCLYQIIEISFLVSLALPTVCNIK